MSYKNRAKIRKFKKQMTSIIRILKFRGGNLSNSNKIILFGSFISFISLFLPWVISSNGNINANSFSSLSGKSGFLIIILLIIILFFIFSFKNKEKIKLLSNIYIKDYLLYIISGLFIFSISFIVLNFVGGLLVLSNNIYYGQGIIINFIGAILIFIGGFLIKKEESKTTKTIFMDENREEEDKLSNNKKDNMKLPF